MIGVHFNKSFAETVVEAMKNGKPIAPPSGDWTGNEMLTLAGMLVAGVFSQGPHTYQLAGITQEMREKLPNERQEAVEQTFGRDIHDAIKYLSTLMFAVIDGEYDQRYEETVEAIVYHNDDETRVMPARGFKLT